MRLKSRRGPDRACERCKTVFTPRSEASQRFCSFLCYVEDKQFYVHRLALGFLRGAPVDAAECVLHSCDVPSCLAPQHLRIGNRTENSADMVSRGRSARGMKNGRHQIDVDTVARIRQAFADSPQIGAHTIAERFGISSGHATSIKNRRFWSHVA